MSSKKVESKLSMKYNHESKLSYKNSDVNFTDQKPLQGKVSELNAELNSIVASSQENIRGS